MDYIPLDYSVSTGILTNPLLIPLVVLGLLFLALGFLLLRRFRRLPKAEQLNYNYIPAFGLGVVLLLSPFLTPLIAPSGGRGAVGYSAARKEQLPEVQRSIQSVYGLKLSEDQVKDLDYPNRKPYGNFQVFGSIDVPVGSKSVPTYLVWTGKSFVLSQVSEGSSLTPLKVES